MFKELIIIKVKGMDIPIEIKRFNNSRGLKLMGTGYNIRVTTTRNINKTRIKEILKPHREKIYKLFMIGIQENLEEQVKKDNLELHAYIEGIANEIVIEPYTKPEISPVGNNYQIIIRMKEEVNYDNIYKQLDKFYSDIAKKYLAIYYETELKYFRYATKPELRIKKMIRQWGNCKKSSPVITLNSHLIKLPPELINYIIFHELAHLIQANHSKEFYKIIEDKYPQRKEIDKKLKLWSFVLKDNYVEEYKGEESD